MGITFFVCDERNLVKKLWQTGRQTLSEWVSEWGREGGRGGGGEREGERGREGGTTVTTVDCLHNLNLTLPVYMLLLRLDYWWMNCVQCWPQSAWLEQHLGRLGLPHRNLNKIAVNFVDDNLNVYFPQWKYLFFFLIKCHCQINVYVLINVFLEGVIEGVRLIPDLIL